MKTAKKKSNFLLNSKKKMKSDLCIYRLIQKEGAYSQPTTGLHLFWFPFSWLHAYAIELRYVYNKLAFLQKCKYQLIVQVET